MIERTQRFKNCHSMWLAVGIQTIEYLGKDKKAGSHYVTEIKSNRNVTINNKKLCQEHESI